MIRLNLVQEKSSQVFRQVKEWGVKLLLLSLFLQTALYFHLYSEYQKKKRGILLLKKQLGEMEKRKEEFLVQTPPEKISGALQARNEWFKAREKMPIFILSRLEKAMPPSIELKGFDSSEGGGSLKILAPSMSIATSYLNGVLGTKNVRITMVDRIPTGIIAACSWTD